VGYDLLKVGKLLNIIFNMKLVKLRITNFIGLGGSKNTIKFKDIDVIIWSK